MVKLSDGRRESSVCFLSTPVEERRVAIFLPANQVILGFISCESDMYRVVGKCSVIVFRRVVQASVCFVDHQMSSTFERKEGDNCTTLPGN